MRDRNLLYLFLGLNVALAGAFVTYLYLSSNGQPKVVSTSFPTATKTNQIRVTTTTNVAKNAQSIPTPGAVAVTSTSATNLAQPTNALPQQPVFTQKKFSWKDVETPEYVAYINSLRAVGCPEEKVRTIVLGDISEWFQQKKLKVAVENDQKWWKSGQTE